MDIGQYCVQWGSKTRWAVIVSLLLLVAVLDFLTPPEFMVAYLYVLLILVSTSFLKPRVAKSLLLLSVLATLLNSVYPRWGVDQPSVLVNRLICALALLITAFYMVRYMRYQKERREHEKLMATERHLAQIREDFIATLTHDLKTPMLGEDKTLQYLLEGAFGPLLTEQQDVLQAVQRGNQRQLTLVTSLLAAYRHDNTGVDLSLGMVDMDVLIADMVTELQHIALERDIQLVYLCAAVPPCIQGEALQLKRVLANLIHNALNYSPGHSQVTIQLAHETERVRVSVADEGPGLSAQDLRKVFHRFYRSDHGREVVGTGLGLYLSRQIILAHHGHIWAENIFPQGCRFTFTLPITITLTRGDYDD